MTIQTTVPIKTLTVLSAQQADYIGVTADGPYKPEHYRD
jgi:hypothetical protein